MSEKMTGESSDSQEMPANEPGKAKQTRTYLMGMLEANGLRPRRQLGQNFLIDMNLLSLLIDSAPLERNDIVLEIGSGTGGLTNRLSHRAGWVVSAEIDPGFYQLARNETAHLPNVTLLHIDALQGKNKFRPEILAAVKERMEVFSRPYYHLVANLPYDVSASVIGNLLLEDLPVKSLTFTVQLEMGQRLCAQPGCKDYGPLSILVQRMGQASWMRTLPPDVFWPRPKIQSAILRIDVDETRRQDLPFARKFSRFVRDLFLHRRKMLRPAVASVPGYKQTKSQLDELIPRVGLSCQERAENLTPEQLERLFRELLPLADAPKEGDT